MWKLLCVFCILSVAYVCNGERFEKVEMKSYLVKPTSIEQLQSLIYLRDTQNQYFFQGGPIGVNKPQRIFFPQQLESVFLNKMRQHHINSPTEYDRKYLVDQRNNFIEQEKSLEECSKQLGDACLEDDDCCDGRCKPLMAHSRSCQN